MKCHWINDVLSVRNVDCWQLVRMIYEQRGVSLPMLPGIASASIGFIAGLCEREQSNAADWSEVSVPFDGALVAMSQKLAIHHVGVYAIADGGKIVHWCEGRVIADTMRLLRVRGFRTIKFYRHQLWPLS